jgi:hypothetical protein
MAKQGPLRIHLRLTVMILKKAIQKAFAFVSLVRQI